MLFYSVVSSANKLMKMFDVTIITCGGIYEDVDVIICEIVCITEPDKIC